MAILLSMSRGNTVIEPAHEKRDLMVFQFVVLQMRSPLLGQQTCIYLPLKLP